MIKTTAATGGYEVGGMMASIKAGLGAAYRVGLGEKCHRSISAERNQQNSDGNKTRGTRASKKKQWLRR